MVSSILFVSFSYFQNECDTAFDRLKYMEADILSKEILAAMVEFLLPTRSKMSLRLSLVVAASCFISVSILICSVHSGSGLQVCVPFTRTILKDSGSM